MLNQQPIEKPVRTYDGSLDIHSIFYTIQGEGPFSGNPALFIRLAGCNLQCPWCDTEYTQGRRRMAAQELANAVLLSDLPSGGLVVITGGEPFRQPLGELINLLIDLRFFVQVETNGTLAPPANVSWSQDPHARKGAYIVCSPKAGRVNATTAAKACCFKYVLDADSISLEDGLPLTALGHTAHPQLARPPRGKLVYLQPADHKDPEANASNLQAAIRSCQKHGYALQLQVHKLMGLE